jgi:signal transduction histidine kinase
MLTRSRPPPALAAVIAAAVAVAAAVRAAGPSDVSPPLAFREASAAPHQADEQTLHLWHFDEPGPPFRDAGPREFDLHGLLNGATAGRPSLPGFGFAIHLNASAGGLPGTPSLRGGLVAPHPFTADGPEDDARPPFAYYGPGGAFTYEALVKFDVPPAHAPGIASCILSLDGETGQRVFNFRIEKDGVLAFYPLPDSGAAGGAIAALPAAGPHACTTADWFHVAVTYDGNEGTAGNLKLFWTRVAPGIQAAHLLGVGMLSHDFNGVLGDFAIGNEARTFRDNAESEPFPGLIDEVRLSGIARDPRDMVFGDRAAPPARPAPAPAPPAALALALERIEVDGRALPGKPAPASLRLPPGAYRIDFHFRHGGSAAGPVAVRCHLAGMDERWQATEQGMFLAARFLDHRGATLARSTFPWHLRGPGWVTDLLDSSLEPRREPLRVPFGAVTLELVLSSGTPDTTGMLALDDLKIRMLPDRDEPGEDLWDSFGFGPGEHTGAPTGTPAGWSRGGSEPAIARLAMTSRPPALALVDADSRRHGEWSTRIPLDPLRHGGRILALTWAETYNVIGGSQHRASFFNVPPGEYRFRAIAAAAGTAVGRLEIPVDVRLPVAQRGWFWPLVSGAAICLLAIPALLALRHGAYRRLEQLRVQHALERDRARIARDLHDDLGTRVTALAMTAARVERELARDPAAAAADLDKMSGAARDLAASLDQLVWSVDSAHDSVEHLASHLLRLGEDLFRDSPVRCRFDIPLDLPPLPLPPERRHHLAMAAKEAMHNILKHAGPCTATLALRLDDHILAIRIADTGRGFDPAAATGHGHGLANLHQRIAAAAGTCRITSAPGRGATIEIHLPLPTPPRP